MGNLLGSSQVNMGTALLRSWALQMASEPTPCFECTWPVWRWLNRRVVFGLDVVVKGLSGRDCNTPCL